MIRNSNKSTKGMRDVCVCALNFLSCSAQNCKFHTLFIVFNLPTEAATEMINLLAQVGGDGKNVAAIESKHTAKQ